MQTTASEVRQAALEEFASSGYLGATIQAIADRAGVSKASVLYHYASKETLLDAALGPAIDEIATLLPGTLARARTPEEQRVFLVEFVDLLIRHRLAAQIFITQSGTLADLPIVVRAQDMIRRIAEDRPERDIDDIVRSAVALGGAAYLLAQTPRTGALAPDESVLRDSLVRILGELLAPAVV
ncbi:TetR/AcrR family transcriptional regulator [Homoserinibacter sp. GY 40078]|uniref:TetR/AcrR family transcriptional regulator n=1 Tax=Homoserinibacter sp. GY 40078 TaxID=2603275 RepID=UPI0011CC0203|nr:TetR/AcrR family transcriptional regulator [Homoserinibacter sp. GY 40078]TXK16316.1 TetR/AcrR family transcriptional regulator [Homoserinibacter sp. GY 40078]